MRAPEDLLPLKPLVFRILLTLADGERHGWSIVRELQQRQPDQRLLPGNLYRTLDAMRAEGLIEEREPSQRARDAAAAPGGPGPRRFFALTPFGRHVARAEARRFEELVAESRHKRLLGAKSRP
jgi:DNA-binding PadR family transcriptional regulator